MTNASLSVLGSGSALPLSFRFNASYVLRFGEKYYMIDCGEGAQVRAREMGIKAQRINNIFISHLHGDHCFGLLPFISTMALLGRHAPLTVHAHPDFEPLLRSQIQFFTGNLPFDLRFNPIDPTRHAIIFQDRTLTVSTLPLSHSVPTCGFLFEEKPRPRHFRPEMTERYSIPLAAIPAIKDGHDFITPDGQRIPNSLLTTPPDPVRRFAYCSDTRFIPSLAELIRDIDLLFHEATYADSLAPRAKAVMHSTALQAAQIAAQAHARKLVIGHFSSQYRTPQDYDLLLNEARQVFPNTVLATDRLVIPF
ncbi:MAG: ribonuclease Z [Paludibacteraceae bacterium]|nr:ribonuclease Z [Paludibacteraceae bacterium]